MDAIKTVNSSMARKNLGNLITEVKKSNKGICLLRRSDKVGLVPFKYLEFSNPAIPPHKKLAVACVDYLLSGAPEHLKTAQLSEIEALPLNKAIYVLTIKSLPLDPATRKTLNRKLGQKFIERLEKRHEVTQVIKKAEDEGLYEVIEHTTGMVDLS